MVIEGRKFERIKRYCGGLSGKKDLSKKLKRISVKKDIRLNNRKAFILSQYPTGPTGVAFSRACFYRVRPVRFTTGFKSIESGTESINLLFKDLFKNNWWI